MRLRLPTRLGGRRRRVAERVDLTDWNALGDDVVTHIARPDALRPIDHPLPGSFPNRADCQLEITQVVAELAERGALDDGTDDALDYWIDDRLGQWRAWVEQHAADRRHAAQRLLAVSIQNLLHEEMNRDDLQARVDRLAEAERQYRAQLLAARVGAALSGSESSGQVQMIPPVAREQQ